MERAWLQEQTALGAFDAYKDQQSFNVAKPTAAPAPSLEPRPGLTAGGRAEVVYDPQDPGADWSGFVPKGVTGRRAHHAPAAFKENIVRTEMYGITPADDAPAHDAWKPLRKPASVPKPADGGLLLAGPTPLDPARAEAAADHFKTEYQASTAHEATPLQRKTDECRSQHVPGKRRVGPAYERDSVGPGTTSWDSFSAPCLHAGPDGGGAQGTQRLPIGRAMVHGGTGSLLAGLGQQVAAARPGLGNGRNEHRREHASAATPPELRKELYTENFSRSQMPGYTGNKNIL